VPSDSSNICSKTWLYVNFGNLWNGRRPLLPQTILPSVSVILVQLIPRTDYRSKSPGQKIWVRGFVVNNGLSCVCGSQALSGCKESCLCVLRRTHIDEWLQIVQACHPERLVKQQLFMNSPAGICRAGGGIDVCEDNRGGDFSNVDTQHIRLCPRSVPDAHAGENHIHQSQCIRGKPG